MIRLLAPLLVAAAGLTTLVTHPNPVETQSAVTPGKPRVVPPRAARGVRRVPLPVTPLVPRGKDRPQPSPAALSVPAGGGTRLNWDALAACESSGNPRAVSMGRYFGLYQFDVQTWASVGGTGNPADASPAEQTHRASLLYAERGTAPWPVCGWHLLEAS